MFEAIFHKLEKSSPTFGHMVRRVLRGEQLMGLRQIIQGEENSLAAKGAKFTNASLDIIGDRNQILVGEGCLLNNLVIRIRGSDHRIVVGRNCRIVRSALFWLEDDHCLLEIGQDTSMVESTIAVIEPNSRVSIGSDCMFANDIDIRVGDSHSVINAETGERINFAEDITIGDHVWLAAHTVVLKGVNIGKNSIVATGAVVTRSCEPGAILAGNPAKVIKTGITWTRDRILKSE